MSWGSGMAVARGKGARTGLSGLWQGGGLGGWCPGQLGQDLVGVLGCGFPSEEQWLARSERF